MMRHVLNVFLKESLDNLRDRRTVTSALIFGPLFGPALFAVMVTVMVEQTLGDADAPVAVEIMGAEHAPNLVEFLESRNFYVEAVDDDLPGARAAVADGRLDFALRIPPEYPEQFADGLPARVQLVSDTSDTSSASGLTRLRRSLETYRLSLAYQRLQVRGISQTVMHPIAVESIDVSTPTGRSVLLLGMVTYFLLFATLLGGMYLAIDTTAGERERGSLEPLLTLPVPRGDLVLGKLLATCAWMALSLAVAIAAFTFSLQFVPFAELGMRTNFGPGTAAAIFLAILPFVPFGAALLTLVASFTRSYKEAQSYLSVVLLVPTLPIIFAAIAAVRPSAAMMAVPSLGQHLLVTGLLRGESLPAPFVAISVASTLAAALVLVLAVRWLYAREGLLGHA